MPLLNFDVPRITRHRRIIDPEILQQSSESEEERAEDEDDEGEKMDIEDRFIGNRVKLEMESSDDDEELGDEAIERRRQRLRLKAKEREEVRSLTP